MSKLTSADLKVAGCGPIETSFEYKMTGKFGLHVLLGPSGSGKSEVLRDVSWAVSGAPSAGKPGVNRVTGKGLVEVGDRKLKVTTRVTKSGELELAELGELSMDEIHYPDVKSVIKRDDRRIKAILRLSEIEDPAALFADLDDYATVVDPKLVARCDGDVVLIAGTVKRAYEGKARDSEGKASDALTEQTAAEERIEGVDTDAETDMEVLSRNQAAAIQTKTELAEQVKLMDQLDESATDAETWLDNYEPPERSVDDLDAENEELTSKVDDLVQQIGDIRREADKRIDELHEQEAKAITSRTENLQAMNEAAKSEEKQREQQKVVSRRDEESRPTEAELSDAEAAVEAAAKAIIDGNAATVAAETVRRIETLDGEIRESTARGEKLRALAKEATGVLSTLLSEVPGCPIVAKMDVDDNARLYIERSGALVEFDELSDGEKWNIIIPMCFKENAVLIVSQNAFGELSDDAKGLIHTMAEDNSCYVVSAMVVNAGDLRGVYFPDMTGDE